MTILDFTRSSLCDAIITLVFGLSVALFITPSLLALRHRYTPVISVQPQFRTTIRHMLCNESVRTRNIASMHEPRLTMQSVHNPADQTT